MSKIYIVKCGSYILGSFTKRKRARKYVREMHIEIDYNGSYAICKTDGKPFDDCTSLEQARAVTGMKIIIREYEKR